MASTLNQPPTGILLVGSIPLSSAEEVFMRIPAALPHRLTSIPDGEPGERGNYIAWQRIAFPKEVVYDHIGGIEPPAEHPGFTLDSVQPTQFDTVALESYEKLIEARKRGAVPNGIPFQISLPMPYSCIQGHVRPEFQRQMEPFYEQRMGEALTHIFDGIQHHDLAVQWDLCFEVTALEYDRGRVQEGLFGKRDFFKPYFSPVREGILHRVQRLCDIVPDDVFLGLHLCYGDLGHRHFLEPDDLSMLVHLANDIVKMVNRRIDWIHVPVPKGRDDKAYFESLKNLDIGAARLFLGLVHAYDEKGTLKRIAAAQSVISEFGVATECGMGRTPPEELESILQISRSVTNPTDSLR